MKILIYSHAFAPSIGGIEQNTMRMVQGITPRNGVVTLVTSTPAGTMDDSQFPFHIVRTPGLVELLRLIWKTDVVYLAGPSFVPLFLSLLLRKRIAVKHHGYQSICPNGLLFYEPTKTACPGHFMAKRYGACVRCNARTLGWRRSIWKVLLTFPRRWALTRVTQNIAVSHHVDKRISLPRTQVIYHGISDPPESKKPKPENSGTCPKPPLTFAYLGRLVSEKGLPLLIEAAHELDKANYSFCLKLVGDGPERAMLQKQVDLLDLRHCVIFTGAKVGAELEETLRDVTVLVMPSTWEETFGVAAVEQMMRGRVVIATAIGGLGEIVAGGGITFPCGDVCQLTACMRRLLDEPELIDTLGLQAKTYASQLFTEDRMIQEHLRMFSAMLSNTHNEPMKLGEERPSGLRQ